MVIGNRAFGSVRKDRSGTRVSEVGSALTPTVARFSAPASHIVDGGVWKTVSPLAFTARTTPLSPGCTVRPSVARPRRTSPIFAAAAGVLTTRCWLKPVDPAVSTRSTPGSTSA